MIHSDKASRNLFEEPGQRVHGPNDSLVWQRWNDDSNTSEWELTLTRFVYDGNQLVQEILFDVENVEGSWVYTYNDLSRDYLHQPGGNCTARF